MIISFLLMAGSITILNALIEPFQAVTNGYDFIDMQIPITADSILAQLPSYTDDSRRLYLYFMIVDYIFPPLAGLFLSLLWAWMLQLVPTPLTTELFHSPFIAFPFLAALLDWAENIGFFYTVWTYPNYSESLLGAAVWFRELKLIFMNANFLGAGIIVVVVFGLWLRQRSSQRRGNAG